MISRFDSKCWSIEVPEDWHVEQEPVCTSITPKRGVGALQLSAYQNEAACISKEDLLEFALEEGLDSIPFENVKNGDFEGLAMEYHEDKSYWRKAWLRNENVLLYVTYSCLKDHETIEKSVVEAMLLSLKRN